MKISHDLKNALEAGAAAVAAGSEKMKKGAVLAKDGIVEGVSATKEYLSKGIVSIQKNGKKVQTAGMTAVAKGTEKVKEGAALTKEYLEKSAAAVQEKGREAQIAVIKYVDEKKNKRFLDAKLSAFEDGLKEGKTQAAEYIKKYYNFCLAATALSYYFARCDGSISEQERLEIEFDLNSILKNKDLPDALKNQMYEISQDAEITFEKVRNYLDNIGTDTLIAFKKDVDEIISADGDVSSKEAEAKAMFENYLQKRLGDNPDE